MENGKAEEFDDLLRQWVAENVEVKHEDGGALFRLKGYQDTDFQQLHEVVPGRETWMLDRDGKPLFDGDAVLDFNAPGHPEGVRGIIRIVTWKFLNRDGWVVIFDGGGSCGITEERSAGHFGVIKLPE